MCSPTPVMRREKYQNPCNKLGYVTATEIGVPYCTPLSQSNPAPRTTIYDEKPLEYMMKNPLPIHDTYLTTTNDIYHRKKYYDSKFDQGTLQCLAPGLERVLYVKPDWSHKIAEKSFNPKPIYDTSEAKDAFRARHPIADIWGEPVPSDPLRNVYVPGCRDFVYGFPKDEPSAIRAAHPYLTQTAFAHRPFSEKELIHYKAMDGIYYSKPKDVAIKLRVIPMEDIYEQKLECRNRLPNLDHKKEAPAPRDYSVQKTLFRRPLYAGCPPRTFQPVPRLGWAPLTQETYGWPNHCFNKENHTSAFVMCTYQPKQTIAEARKVPWMYTTESQTYGSGRPVSTFLPIHGHTTYEEAINIIGEDCPKLK